MKNLMVHINPKHEFCSRFHNEKDLLARLQIDNSLALGWKPEDIVLVTNFLYEYHGIRAIQVPDICYCPFRPLSSKTVTVEYMLSHDMLKNDIYWVHDFDAYQVTPFDVDLGNSVAGFTDYGWSKKWCLGSYFLTNRAKELFKTIRFKMYLDKLEDERAFTALTRMRRVDGFKKLNITYNFGMRNILHNYRLAEKPIKVLHFHPWYMDSKLPDTTLNMFMYGKNEIGVPLMSKSLITIFQRYGIK